MANATRAMIGATAAVMAAGMYLLMYPSRDRRPRVAERTSAPVRRLEEATGPSATAASRRRVRRASVARWADRLARASPSRTSSALAMNATRSQEIAPVGVLLSVGWTAQERMSASRSACAITAAEARVPMTALVTRAALMGATSLRRRRSTERSFWRSLNGSVLDTRPTLARLPGLPEI